MLDFLLKKYDENLGEIGARYGKIHNWYLFRNLSGAVLGFARDLAAYLFLIYELVQGRISAADFVFLLGVIDSLAVYFERFLRIMMVWNMLDAPVGYFRQFLETGSRYRTDAVVSEEKIAQMKREGIEIELDDVSYTYEGAKKPTISHFHLKIRQGERLAVGVRFRGTRWYDGVRVLRSRRVRRCDGGGPCPQGKDTSQRQHQCQAGRRGQEIPKPAVPPPPFTADNELRVRLADGEKQPLLILHNHPSFSK